MEYCSIEICKISVKELDEETSLRLVITHYCRYEDKLLDELIEVGKKIVKACNSLSLSLKVTSAYFREKTKVERLGAIEMKRMVIVRFGIY